MTPGDWKRAAPQVRLAEGNVASADQSTGLRGAGSQRDGVHTLCLLSYLARMAGHVTARLLTRQATLKGRHLFARPSLACVRLPSMVVASQTTPGWLLQLNVAWSWQLSLAQSPPVLGCT